LPLLVVTKPAEEHIGSGERGLVGDWEGGGEEEERAENTLFTSRVHMSIDRSDLAIRMLSMPCG